MSAAQNRKRIAKNTLMLYARQILILAVSLYTVRVVLNALGVEDYGIYNVVGGIVSVLSFLSGTMASATQRYFSFALGAGDSEKLKRIFVVNGVIYLGIGVVALVLLETVGLWFVRYHLNVPEARMAAVLWIYQFSIFTFIVSILSAPLMAIIIAHEDMQVYAYVSIVEAVLKLGVVASLVLFPMDKLELYGVLIFAVSCVTLAIYAVYCIRKYPECQFRTWHWDRSLFREITGFTGWTLFGQLTTVGRNQAVTILLNQAFSPVVVAARAIAVNITSQINVFSNNFNVGLYPPIIKSYAANNKDEMFTLIQGGSKITFYLLWIFALPMFIGMDTILRLWLGHPPESSVLFTRLALVEVLITSISMPLTTAARAPGDMKTYELSLGSIQLGIFAASWLVLELGAAASSVFVVAIVANILMFFVRLWIVRNLIGLSLRAFSRKVVVPVVNVVVLSTLVSFVAVYFCPTRDIYTIGVMMGSGVVTLLAIYAVGLATSERQKLKTIVSNRLQKAFAT